MKYNVIKQYVLSSLNFPKSLPVHTIRVAILIVLEIA